MISCCCSGREKVVQILLSNGANADAADIDQNTPAHFAAKQGHLFLMQICGSFIITLTMTIFCIHVVTILPPSTTALYKTAHAVNS